MFRVMVTSSVTSRRRQGSTSSCQMACISPGGPGRQMTILPSRSAHQPGAVPCRLRMNRAEGIRSACLMLVEGITDPRLWKYSSSAFTTSSCTTGVSPKAPATASRVRSSLVGPRPPVVMSRSERCNPRDMASVIFPWSSPTMVTHCSWTPRGGSLAAIHDELVSVSSPISSSLPMEKISAFKTSSLCRRLAGAQRGRKALQETAFIPRLQSPGLLPGDKAARWPGRRCGRLFASQPGITWGRPIVERTGIRRHRSGFPIGTG